MKILTPIRKLFDDLGVYPDRKFTWKSLFFFVATASYSCLSAVYLLFSANTLKDYADAFYGWATPLFIFSINAIYAWKRADIFELIDSTESFIEERKLINRHRLPPQSSVLRFNFVKSICLRRRKFKTIFAGMEINPISKKYYEKVSRRIGYWVTFFDITINKLTIPGVMLPSFVMSYFNYYTTDMGGDAFNLPFPMWCVES